MRGSSSLFNWIRLSLAIWGACLLAVGSTLAVHSVARAQERTGIATETVEIWAQRSTSAEVLLTVPPGTRLIVTGRGRKGFYPVTFAGVEGWARTGSVAIAVGRGRQRADDDETNRARRALRGFATEDLNLRTGPSTSDRVQTVIPSGQDLVLTGVEEDGYLAVRYGSETGWVAEDYVRREAAVDPRQPVMRGNPRHMTPEEIIPFIYAAADYYGQPREDMLRVAQCESDLVPMAVNEEGGSYGIFQFKTGTWLSTPYAEYDIFDPRASAYAAAWMWSVGRRNEWVCQ